MSRPQRARALIAVVLLTDAAIAWTFFKEDVGALSPPGDFGLLCMAPSLAALIKLLSSKELSGARLAQVVAWGFVVAGTLGWTFALLFSFGASSSDRIWASVVVGLVLAAQMLIPASLQWARSDVPFIQWLAQYAVVFGVVVLVVAFGLLTS